MKKPKKKHLSWANKMNGFIGFPVQSDLKETGREGGDADSKKKIKMSANQLELLLAYLPDGVVLEILWEDIHEE